MSDEFKDWILIGVVVIGGFGVVAWYKGGGRFDATLGIFVGLFIFLIGGIVLFVIINLVRDYFHNRKK